MHHILPATCRTQMMVLIQHITEKTINSVYHKVPGEIKQGNQFEYDDIQIIGGCGAYMNTVSSPYKDTCIFTVQQQL